MKVKRKFISIDDEKCNGCGVCVSSCAEGALALVDGKARVVREEFCDGFGDCVGTCPTGALKIEEREVEAFSIQATEAHVLEERGEEGKRVFHQSMQKHFHEQKAKGAHPAGCPGSQMRWNEKAGGEDQPTPANGGPKQAFRSELNQWPVQLHLVRPDAPYFKNREIVVLSTCSPVASADIHWRFLRGRSVVIACPKLDRTEPYAEKLAQIISEPTIPRVLVVRMEVPCCGGLTRIVKQAVEMSGRGDLEVREVVVGLGGDIEN